MILNSFLMINNQYLLTVVIATKNRQFYCIETIKSILNIDFDNIVQIAIADNSDSNEIETFVNNCNDPRIKYSYNNAKITNTDNFNYAMNLADGKYITLIGDDDGILPIVFDNLKWALENNIDSFSSRKCVIYYWPNSINTYPKGHLLLPSAIDKIDIIDVKNELKNLLHNGLQHYLSFSLPKVYHGFVKRDIFEAIKNKTGHYFGGLSPDIYACISISTLISTHYVINTPLTIAGVCAKSTTADLFTGKHRGELNSMPHLNNRSHYEWSRLVPEYYSPNTVWAETAIKALEETGNTSIINKYYNSYYLLAQGYVNNRNDISRIVLSKSIIFKNNILLVGWLKFSVSIFICLIKIVTKKAISTMNNWLLHKDIHVNDVIDIHNAVKVTESHYSK